MKTKLLLLCALPGLLFVIDARAGSRSSASDSVPAETVDSGGQRTTSASYTIDASIGGIGGVSAAATPATTAKHSYIGQLYDVRTLTVNASPATVNEGATRQLTATAALDDGTQLTPAAASVTWSVLDGPINSISVVGVVTAGIVYENTPANVRGHYLSASGTLGLLVLNVNNDDFGSYAGDGLDDAWQVQYFGLASPNAGPFADPDMDGQTNGFELVAGTIPTDGLSKFRLTIENVPGQPSHKNIIFNPRFPSRTYTVQSKADVAVPGFADLAGISTTDIGPTRTVTDLNATEPDKFYRVRITLP